MHRVALESQDPTNHVATIRPTGLLVDDVAVAVQHHQRRNCRNAVPGCSLAPDPVQHVESNDFGFASQIFFDPIHDGLGRKAGHSRVGEELEHHGLTPAQ